MFAKIALVFAFTSVFIAISNATYTEVCGENEEYNTCGCACPPTCGDSSPRICDPHCVKGCFCKKGCIKRNGKCITEEKCKNLTKCPHNEHWKNCGPSCPDICGQHKPAHYKKNHMRCRQGCFCNEGYIRRGKDCIPQKECKKIEKQCDKNEEWASCGADCPQICGEPKPDCSNEKCVEGCVCKKGHVRRHGICITDEECKNLTTCSKNEHWTSCGKFCPPICGHTPPWYCPEFCVEGCFCDEGYMKLNGKCISKSECESFTKCGKNEHWKNCGSACPKICGKPKPDNCTEHCVQGCFCNPGYVKHNGTCISDDECNKRTSCRENEEWKKCGTHEICGEKKPENHTKCAEGCYCKEGYVRKNGACISKEKCSNLTTCKHNEIWSNCGSCRQICGDTSPKTCHTACSEGCFCKHGYVTLNGHCVSEADCKNYTKCGENQHWENCGPTCPQTCEGPKLNDCSKQCVQGCFCNEGYVKHNDTCISDKECNKHKTCKTNEEWSYCGSACPKTCEDLKDLKPKICTLQCVQGCFCKSGYVRDKKGQCVLEKECNLNKTCHENKEWSDCSAHCQHICGEPVTPCTKNCVAGCVCKSGTIRKRNGGCISVEECNKLTKCKPNEHWSCCGSSCPQICGRSPPKTCHPKCVEGCFCDEGYARLNGTCVKESQCKEHFKCNKNEIWMDCGSACPPKCKKEPEFCHGPCKPGCFCKDGYILKDGECITNAECKQCMESAEHKKIG